MERGRAPRVRRHRALLVGPRRGRLPHRRLQHDDQGQGAARQPAGHRGRPARPAVHGPARRLQHRPSRGARHPAPLARHRRLLRARAPPHRRDQRGEAPGAHGVLRRRARRAARRLQLRVHQRAAGGRSAAHGRRGHRGPAARGGVAHLDGVQPRRLAPGHPLGGRRPGQGEAGAAAPAHPARHALPLRRRRDRPGRRAHAARGRPRRRGRPLLARLQGPRRRAHADAVERRARRRLHRGGRAHLAAHGRPGRVQRGRPGGRPRLGARALPPGHCGPPGQRRPGRRPLPLAPLARRDVGLRPGRRHHRAAQHAATTRRPSTASPAR